jgi:ribosomal protein L24
MIATAQDVPQPPNRIGEISMAQTYHSDDKVVVVSGPDAGRNATVVDNYEGVYGDDLIDGALVRFDDKKPSKDPVAGQNGVAREFKSDILRRA